MTKPCTEKIEYSRSEIEPLKGKLNFDLKEIALLNDLGTNLVALQINGKQTEIFQIIIREDNSYTGFLTELIGVPFVYYPKFFEKGKHQTVVIYKDNDPKGILSNNDVILHTYHSSAEKILFSELPYKNHKFEILRWKTLLDH